MSHRKVTSVVWARECERPRGIPLVRRATGTRAKGLAYERALARTFDRKYPDILHGQWYSFFADGEHGYCQPDFVRASGGEIVVLECKLTNIEQATEQLLDLYFPILRKTYCRPVRGIIVTRSVHRAPSLATIVSTFNEALVASRDRVPVLHWIGCGPL